MSAVAAESTHRSYERRPHVKILVHEVSWEGTGQHDWSHGEVLQKLRNMYEKSPWHE